MIDYHVQWGLPPGGQGSYTSDGTIDNISNNSVGGSCYTAHQSVSRLITETKLIWSAVFMANARLERAGASAHMNKSCECVIIADSKFSDRVVVRMTPKSTPINYVTISHE